MAPPARHELLQRGEELQREPALDELQRAEQVPDVPAGQLERLDAGEQAEERVPLRVVDVVRLPPRARTGRHHGG